MVAMSGHVRDLRGRRFGKLTVVEYTESDKFKQALWKCVCDCGNECVVKGNRLQQGKTRSCGCAHKEAMAARRKPESYFNRVLRVAKSNAKRRGYAFELTPEEYRDLILRPCHYCARLPADKRFTFRHEQGSFPCHGVDRLDNSMGYTLENSVPCCAKCNFAKMDLTEQDFLRTVELIYRNRIERK